MGIDVVERVVNIEDPKGFIDSAVQKGAEAIVIQALPLSLLSQILPLAQKHGIKILMFEQGKARVFDDKQKAEDFVQQAPDRRVLLISASDSKFRVVEFTGIAEVQEIRILTKILWTPR